MASLTDSTSELIGLRARLSNFQREILNIIWMYYREQRQWISTRVLHHKFDRSSVRSALNQMGGSIVFEARAEGKECYKLTFLGTLLTDQGEELEQLLVEYVGYVRDQFLSNPEIASITNQALQAALGLTADQTRLLGQIIWLSNFYGDGSAGLGNEEWRVGVPYDVDELPSVGDFRTYIRARALRDFDPAVPISENDRMRYLLGKSQKTESSTEFSFIIDTALRGQLAADWREAQNVHQVQAWKSCVLLCGGVIEGMLLDSLGQHEQRAFAAYKRLRQNSPPDLTRWNLIDLVEVAGEAGILSRGTVHLGHALREFRNLIHPGKLAREKVQVTEEEADIALRAVRLCVRALSRVGDAEN